RVSVRIRLRPLDAVGSARGGNQDRLVIDADECGIGRVLRRVQGRYVDDRGRSARSRDEAGIAGVGGRNDGSACLIQRNGAVGRRGGEQQDFDQVRDACENVGNHKIGVERQGGIFGLGRGR